MKKARLIVAVVLASLAISGCAAEHITFPADCVDPGGNHYVCDDA